MVRRDLLSTKRVISLYAIYYPDIRLLPLGERIHSRWCGDPINPLTTPTTLVETDELAGIMRDCPATAESLRLEA